MDLIPFCKMSGSGNDFIIINNQALKFSSVDLHSFVRKSCCRRFSIGADGLIVIEKSEISDFKWIFFNSDGSIAEMCGNGARCAARYAYVNNIAGKKMMFETVVGIVCAEIVGDSVKIRMTNPKDIKLSYKIELENYSLLLNSINTGVPHAVVFVSNINDIDVVKIGRRVCHHRIFQPKCTNVNFVKVLSDGSILIRTYERGVESETLACGTGNVAAAIMCAMHCKFKSPVSVTNRSGNKLKVYFKKNGNIFEDVFLKGDARIIYTGMLWKEGWKYSQVW